MELWTALVIGFFGSFHCLGMCGPIALALPMQQTTQRYWLGRILYNFGRAITYTILGVLFGLFGVGFNISGWQQSLSIIAGVFILFMVILPRFYRGGNVQTAIFSKVKNRMMQYFKSAALMRQFTIGIFNGLLPCAFVYLALGAVLIAPNPVYAGMYMFIFGLGTFPAMLLISLSGSLFKPRFSSFVNNKLLPVFSIFLGMMLILRGLSLDIPYLSPVIDNINEVICR